MIEQWMRLPGGTANSVPSTLWSVLGLTYLFFFGEMSGGKLPATRQLRLTCRPLCESFMSTKRADSVSGCSSSKVRMRAAASGSFATM